MKNYFVRLFNYDCYANGIMVQAINYGGIPQHAARLMAHLLAAQQIWLNRVQGLPQASVVLWPELVDPDTDLAGSIQEKHALWMTFLNNDAIDFDKIIHYQNLKGVSFSDTLADILAHVINHGTHHRAQIGQQLISAGGGSLPVTDYIAYVRQINS